MAAAKKKLEIMELQASRLQACYPLQSWVLTRKELTKRNEDSGWKIRVQRLTTRLLIESEVKLFILWVLEWARWALGCVNCAPWLTVADERESTQPSSVGHNRQVVCHVALSSAGREDEKASTVTQTNSASEIDGAKLLHLLLISHAHFAPLL